MATIFILVILATFIMLAIRSLVKQKNKGGCHGSCGGCGGCNMYHDLQEAFQKETK